MPPSSESSASLRPAASSPVAASRRRYLARAGAALQRLAPRWPLAAWIAAIAIAPALTFASIVQNGENVPWYDEWTMVPIFQKHEDGRLGFEEFWQQHNEHRPVIPKAADFGMGLLTDWNLKAEMYRNFVVALLTFVVLLLALRRSLDRVGFVVASVVASILYFSPMQWENWLWGWQLEWFLAMLGAVGAFWALTVVVDRSPRRGLALGALCALVATFSLGQGLLVWPIGLALLLLRRRPWRVWALLSAVTAWLYIIDYEFAYDEPGAEPSKGIFLERPFEFLQYVCLYLGRPFGGGTATSIAAGAVLLALFLAASGYVVRHRGERDLLDRSALFIGAGLYGLLGAVITGISRLEEGVEQAAASRYAGVAALFAIATLALVYAIVRSPVVAGRDLTTFTRRRIMADVAVPLVLVSLVNWSHGLDAMDRKGRQLDAIATCTRQLRSADDPCLRNPPPSPYPETVAWTVYLRIKGYAGY